LTLKATERCEQNSDRPRYLKIRPGAVGSERQAPSRIGLDLRPTQTPNDIRLRSGAGGGKAPAGKCARCAERTRKKQCRDPRPSFRKVHYHEDAYQVCIKRRCRAAFAPKGFLPQRLDWGSRRKMMARKLVCDRRTKSLYAAGRECGEKGLRVYYSSAESSLTFSYSLKGLGSFP